MPHFPFRAVIFTDLDETLLDRNYSWREAAPALQKIRDLSIPLILTTSKTRGEVEAVQTELGMGRQPFIPENGGAVYFPSGYFGLSLEGAEEWAEYTLIRLGKPYREIRDFVEQVRVQIPLKGFGDFSVEEVSAKTGLSIPMAALAKEREFTEPFLLDDERELPFLQNLAMKRGLKVTTGGRFHHLIGMEQDKGRAVEETIRIFSSEGMDPVFIGLGDSPNDFPMLSRVDIPILIPRTGGSVNAPEIPGIVRAHFPGSRGWNESILRVLEDF
ncbi:MAG: HAD-IIB family hydrolase [Desulfobacteraceae bacterium]|nr:MAG: HAD-IIB family hydrolase [Desulfobacteraceae bacterium]